MTEKYTPTEEAALQLEIAELMVQALNLDVSAAEIQPDEPLYGNGLGLDSIDILEVALVVSKRYGLQLKADSEDNHRIFGSLRSLTEYVAAHKTR
ncbi:acyl carrier protein [Methylobacillus sp. MM3]|jgi:acyl carrier protein|uniref:phosphopantetheine-binding protein n=1 Tax=Methylobacillus sp. MM3 TaxID=1848039 RepID=UPI0007E22EDF|nr:phosphopantetheine-binding protein [Methylobacillus sp. MM3]OAJ71192.1 acyl carrier protein [Methylobacillus sp. MM3]